MHMVLFSLNIIENISSTQHHQVINIDKCNKKTLYNVNIIIASLTYSYQDWTIVFIIIFFA